MNFPELRVKLYPEWYFFIFNYTQLAVTLIVAGFGQFIWRIKATLKQVIIRDQSINQAIIYAAWW